MHCILRVAVIPVLVAFLAVAPSVLAQAYPAKPIRMIVPFPPGGVNDNSARAINQALTQVWGQPIVVENRAGANGNIGMEACAKSAPDGYTICYPTGVIMSLNPFAYSKMPFEPMDLVPVIHVGTLDQVLAVNAALPVNSVRELIEYAKAHPGTVTWASLGMGSSAHLYLEWFRAKTGANFVHVPYKGSPQLLLAVAGGEVHVSTNTPATVAPHVKSGKLKALSVVADSKKRSPILPGVPTLAEQGYELDFRNWLALYFPRGTPSEYATRWNAEVNKLLSDPKFVERYIATLAVTATGGTPEDLIAFYKKNREAAAELAKIAKLRFD